MTLKVTSGLWEWDATWEGTRQTVAVETAFPHKTSGVAVLKLANDLILTPDFVWPASLAHVDPPTNQHCMGAGWGRVNWAAGRSRSK